MYLLHGSLSQCPSVLSIQTLFSSLHHSSLLLNFGTLQKTDSDNNLCLSLKNYSFLQRVRDTTILLKLFIFVNPFTTLNFLFRNCNLYVMWLATINLMRPWGIVYKMKKKNVYFSSNWKCQKACAQNIFFLHRIFFFTAVSFEIMSYYFFQKLELTADEQNRHPGELSRATFEVSLWGLGKILAW